MGEEHGFAGLCGKCAHCEKLAHPRGGVPYFRCLRAKTDAAFPKFPRLPVLRCKGFEEKK